MFIATDNFPELSSMLEKVKEIIDISKEKESEGEEPRRSPVECLKDFMKTNQYWPDIQIKSFFDRSGLILLHTPYNKTSQTTFQKLYDQCRSVVINLNAPSGENIVVSMGSSIPERVTLPQFEAMRKESDDISSGDRFYNAMEGTTVYCYNHDDKWYFGTTACPLIDKSSFYKQGSFGDMLNEALLKLPFKPTDVNVENVREWFTSTLDKERCYSFVLVHHKNSRFMDYSDMFGDKEYAKIYLISMKDRKTLQDYCKTESTNQQLEMPPQIQSYDEIIKNIQDPNVYGVIVRNPSRDRIYMIVSDEVRKLEDECLGHPNHWYNMLYVFQKNNPEFRLRDYIEKYLKEWEVPKDNRGNEIQPVAVISTIFKALQRVLYESYRMTTKYSIPRHSYLVLKEQDKLLPPAVRFHITQLRNLHIKFNPDQYLSPTMVYDYLCHHMTMKNMRILIETIARTGFGVSAGEATAFYYMQTFLSD